MKISLLFSFQFNSDFGINTLTLLISQESAAQTEEAATEGTSTRADEL
jgi:hypothetical protein